MSAARAINRFTKDHFYLTVGNRITGVRESKSISQDELARHTKLTKATIDHAEAGQSCSLLVITMIAEALDVTIDELVPLEAIR